MIFADSSTKKRAAHGAQEWQNWRCRAGGKGISVLTMGSRKPRGLARAEERKQTSSDNSAKQIIMSSPAVSPSSSTLQFDRKARANQSRNPVSLRLYKVLGTNFDHEATREALQTLSELYATSATTVKGKEIARSAEDDELDEELVRPTGIVAEELLTEAIPGESAARARKNLRRDMEKKLAEGSHQFLKAFSEVDQVRPTCAP